MAAWDCEHDLMQCGSCGSLQRSCSIDSIPFLDYINMYYTFLYYYINMLCFFLNDEPFREWHEPYFASQDKLAESTVAFPACGQAVRCANGLIHVKITD